MKWFMAQPPEVTSGSDEVVYGRYSDTLKAAGATADRAASTVALLQRDTNELVQLFSGLRIIRYEDTEAVADFGLERLRIVRLAAVKP